MRRTQSVVNLDPIDRKNRKNPGFIGRMIMTRHFRGKPMKKTEAIGHWCFVGKQRSGKTVSAIWTRDYLIKKYKKRGKKIVLFDNMNLGGIPVTKYNFPELIEKCEYKEDTYYIFLIDEIQSWYKKDTKDQVTLMLIDKLCGQFSQLGKRQIYVLSTAQIYGRINKDLREQCVYMINCRPSKIKNKALNEFIDGEDIICDELGRWSGTPLKIWVHGLPETKFDTHLMIKS